MFSRTPISVIPFVIAFILVAAGTAYHFLRTAPVDIRKFTGSLVTVENGTVTLRGAFYPVPGPVPERFRSERDFIFRTDTRTRIFGISLSRPSPDKILSNGGRYKLKLNELPRKEAPGSLEELKKLIGTGMVRVDASFSSSIINAKNPVAASLIYRYLATPDFKKL